jgi:hypothetical protein
MTKDWVQEIANSIKHKEHTAAKDFTKQQQAAEVMTTKGRYFFDTLVTSLVEDIEELNEALKGDVTGSTIVFQNLNQDQVAIRKERFPTVMANIVYSIAKITLTIQQKPVGSGYSESYCFQAREDDSFCALNQVQTDVPFHNEYKDGFELGKHIMRKLFVYKP